MKYTKLALFLFVISCAILTSCGDQANISKGKVGGLYEAAIEGESYRLKNSDEQFILDTISFISFDDFDAVTNDGSENGADYYLTFTLNESGASKFKRMSERNLNKEVYLVKYDEIIVAGQIVQVIADGRISLSIKGKDTANELFSYLTN
jgi:preprotein translocase subunit SecD